MAETVRSLSIVLELIDNATRKLKEVQAQINAIESTEAAVAITADTSAAISGLQDVAAASEQTKQHAGALQKAMETLKSAFTSVGNSLDGFKGKLQTLQKGLNEVKSAMLGAQMASAGLIFTTARAAMQEEELAAAMRAAFKDSAGGMMEWVAAADKMTGVMRPQRMEMALLLQQAGLSNEKIIEYSETLEKFWSNPALRYRAQAAGISSVVDLAEQLKFAQMGGGRAYALAKLFGKENIEDVIQYGHGANKVISLMNRSLDEVGGTAATTGKRWRGFSEVLQEFQSEIGSVLLPAITNVLIVLTEIVKVIKAIPGAREFVAYGAVFVFIASSIGLLLTALVSTAAKLITFLELLSKFPGIAKIAVSALSLIRAAIMAMTAAMAANPILLAIMLIVAALIILETKFGLVSKAIDRLKKIEWVKLISAAFEQLSKLLDWIISKLGGITALFGKLGGGSKMLFAAAAVSPIAGAGMFSMKFLEEFFPQALGTVRGFFEEVKQHLNEIKKFVSGLIPGWLSKLFEMISGLVDWLKGAWAALASWLHLPWAEEKSKTTGTAVPRALTPEEQLALNATQYNLEEAQGLMGGVPATGIAEMPGKVAAFGGAYKQYAFKNPQGVVRTGAELSEEQLLSGLWTPVSLVDEQGGFVRPLSEEEIKRIQEELQKKREAQAPPKKPKEEKKEPVYHIPPVPPSKSAAGWTPEEAAKQGKKLTQPPSDLPQASPEAQQAYYEERQKRGEESGLIEPGSAPAGGMGISEATGGKYTDTDESGGAKRPSESSAPAGGMGISEATGGKYTDTDESGGAKRPSESSAPAEGETEKPEPSDESEPPKKEKKKRRLSWEGLADTAIKFGLGAPGAQEGGQVLRTGRAIIHEGEEVIPAESKRAYIKYTIPEILREIDQIKGALGDLRVTANGVPILPEAAHYGAGTAPPTNIIINAPLIEHAHLASHMDLDNVKAELIKFLRFEIRSALKS